MGAKSAPYKIYFGGSYTSGSFMGGATAWGLFTGGLYFNSRYIKSLLYYVSYQYCQYDNFLK